MRDMARGPQCHFVKNALKEYTDGVRVLSRSSYPEARDGAHHVRMQPDLRLTTVRNVHLR